MKNSLLKVGAFLSLAALVLTGCGQKMRAPSASDTMVGAGSRNPGWAAPGSGIDGSLSGEGLSSRDGGLSGDLMDRIRSGNVNPADILQTVYFDFDQYGVRASERAKVEACASQLQGSTLRVVAVGYTDWYGTEQYNLALAERRSIAVQSYLANLGISNARVEILSMGKLHAVPNVEKQSNEARNDRRVDIIKLDGSAATPAALEL